MSKSYTYEEVKYEFEKRGFTLLTTEYVNCKQHLLYLDKQGYKVFTCFDKLINRGSDGRRFHPSNPYTIENINHYAELNNIDSRCVSTEYVSANSYLLFECKCGEPFSTTWDAFSAGHKIKCDTCSNNPFANKDYHSVKETLLKLGYYLDVGEDEYLGVTITPLICYDAEGYKYRIVYDSILRGKTPVRIGKSNPFSIYNINNFLKLNKKDFTCISDEFISRDHLLEFVCNRCDEHVFDKWCNMYKTDNPNRSILLCPNCDGRTESLHALVLKQMFCHNYPDTITEEPSCINPLTNNILPTDIVNHRLKIAIEIQSEWHDREYQKIKDSIKKEYWIAQGYSFYAPDIRNYSVLGMCQLFFDITEIPDYINFEYNNKLNIKKIQSMLDKNMSPKEISQKLEINIHRIYDAIGYGKLHYSNTYLRSDYRPVVQLNLNKEYMSRYDCIADASRANNIPLGNIVTCLLDNRSYANGYYWVYEKDYLSGNYKIVEPRFIKFLIPVDRYDLDGNFICHFDTILEASKDCKSTNYEILEVINGVRKSSYGYKYKQTV